MKILLTNDDGIHAPGLWAAGPAPFPTVGEVAVVAPDREQSGVGASMTQHSPLFVHQVPAEQYLAQFAPGAATPPTLADAVPEPLPADVDVELPHLITAWSVQGTPG